MNELTGGATCTTVCAVTGGVAIVGALIDGVDYVDRWRCHCTCACVGRCITLTLTVRRYN